MNELRQRIITGSILITFGLILFFLAPPLYFSILFVAILGLILFFEWPKLVGKNSWLWLLTPLYPIAPFICLIYLNQTHHSLLLPLILFAASYDSGAYFIGKKFGRHKIAARISPGKTWEGFFGGLLFTVFTCCLYQLFSCGILTLKEILLVSCAIAFMATLGDFFESLLKRYAQLKDSGSLLPGHGGLLDRFDSILFVGIFFFIFKNFLTKLFCL